MIDPPSDSLEKSVLENLMMYRSNRKTMLALNGALMGVYGSVVAAGGGDTTDIDDLIKEMNVGIN